MLKKYVTFLNIYIIYYIVYNNENLSNLVEKHSNILINIVPSFGNILESNLFPNSTLYLWFGFENIRISLGCTSLLPQIFILYNCVCAMAVSSKQESLRYITLLHTRTIFIYWHKRNATLLFYYRSYETVAKVSLSKKDIRYSAYLTQRRCRLGDTIRKVLESGPDRKVILLELVDI